MSKEKVSKVAFNGTAEQKKLLMAFLEENKNVQGVLMPALQKAQEIYGYLPIEVQMIISEVLDIPLEEIYGVVTFYSQFTLNPKGKYNAGVCLGTACYVKGSGDVIAKLKEVLKLEAGECTEDGKFSLEATRCIGCCGLAPVMTINADVYGKVTPAQIAEILAKY